MSLEFVLSSDPGRPARRFRFTRSRVAVGRAEKGDVVVKSDAASRHHLELVRKGRVWMFQDLGSLNGTVYNGRRAQAGTLRAGDELMLGQKGPVLRIISVSGSGSERKEKKKRREPAREKERARSRPAKEASPDKRRKKKVVVRKVAPSSGSRGGWGWVVLLVLLVGVGLFAYGVHSGIVAVDVDRILDFVRGDDVGGGSSPEVDEGGARTSGTSSGSPSRETETDEGSSPRRTQTPRPVPVLEPVAPPPLGERVEGDALRREVLSLPRRNRDYEPRTIERCQEVFVYCAVAGSSSEGPQAHDLVRRSALIVEGDTVWRGGTLRAREGCLWVIGFPGSLRQPEVTSQKDGRPLTLVAAGQASGFCTLLRTPAERRDALQRPQSWWIFLGPEKGAISVNRNAVAPCALPPLRTPSRKVGEVAIPTQARTLSVDHPSGLSFRSAVPSDAGERIAALTSDDLVQSFATVQIGEARVPLILHLGPRIRTAGRLEIRQALPGIGRIVGAPIEFVPAREFGSGSSWPALGGPDGLLVPEGAGS